MSKKPEIRNHLVKYTLYFMGLVTAAGIVLATIEIATSGSEMAKLTADEMQLKNDNLYMKEQLVETSSLSSYEKLADNYGFRKPGKTLYINYPDRSVAEKLP